MQTPYRIIFSLFLCCTGSGSFAQQPPAPANAQAQAASSPQLPPQSPDVVIRTEKKLVLVDTVVTDKKGNYIHGMTQKDFRVWEDGKEQDIESFSAESDPASPLNNQKHYLVLFFDTTSMQTADQIYARKAALQFLDSNGGPNRLTAIVNFTGSLQIAQNFTNDSDRLKQVVNGVKFSSVSSNPEFASLGSPQLGRAAADFGARDVLLGLRTLAKNLGTVPGRKTLIFMSSGFLLNLELRSELTAVIDVCNHANVAIYPIDVRGLVAENVRCPHQSEFGCAETGEVALVKAAYFAQHGSGGGGRRSCRRRWNRNRGRGSAGRYWRHNQRRQSWRTK